MAKTSVLQEYARVGATARIGELQAEIAAIHRLFPDLEDAHKSHGRSKTALAALMDRVIPHQHAGGHHEHLGHEP